MSIFGPVGIPPKLYKALLQFEKEPNMVNKTYCAGMITAYVDAGKIAPDSAYDLLITLTKIKAE